MRRRTCGLFVSLAVISTVGVVMPAVGLAAPPGAYGRPGHAEQVNVSSAGAQGNGASVAGAVSRNGRFAVFGSSATNLVSRDVNGRPDVFWRDRVTRMTRLAEVSSDGVQGVGIPGALSSEYKLARVSADGRYVAFRSAAINLVPGDTNMATDVFRRDMVSGKTIRVSVGSGGTQGSSDAGYMSMSADGRYIAFESAATNLVAGDTNDVADIFVRDIKLGKTIRASVSSTGKQANGFSTYPTITANGRWLAFTSKASNLVPGVSGMQVYWRDLVTGKTVVVSVASDGSSPSFSVFPTCDLSTSSLPVELPPGSPVSVPDVVLRSFCHTRSHEVDSISDDGRYVVFASTATNLVPNDSNWAPGGLARGQDVFVRDVVAGRTERVSVDSYGRDRRNQEWMEWASISGNGRMIAYMAQNPRMSCLELPLPSLIPCLNGSAWDAVTYTYDRLSGEMEFPSRTPTGARVSPPAASVTNPLPWLWHYPNGFSFDGRYLVVNSNAPDFAANDKNGQHDMFVRDRGPASGVGGFGGGGSGSGPAPEPEVCVADGVCLPPLAASDDRHEVRVADADLIGARVVPRPQLGDLFMRLDLARIPRVAGVPAGGLLYGLAFTAGGSRYEVRVQRVPGADFDAKGGASFGLFRQDPASGLFTKVATLKGGYGTVGESVVFAVPVKELGAANGGRLSDVRAFTGVGSYLTGVTKVLDSMRLGR